MLCFGQLEQNLGLESIARCFVEFQALRLINALEFGPHSIP